MIKARRSKLSPKVGRKDEKDQDARQGFKPFLH